MTEYFLVNHQDYFATGFIINNGGAYVDTAAGLDVAAAVKTADPASAKTALYHQVLTHPAAGSERDQLTEQEQAQLTQKLDENFSLISTDNLESC
ncbi:hypothetical protein FC99_GL000771 [Levilactobacillus koreensis JCM 16448]|uniref:Uncharacterized protein n=1 Tax=Levilactobacillus koreensis TaxID=637971 RepID=A0AAC8UU08_9LACO|nr:hypothetical protein [Levilactobacillus koreensis]AKP64143.1 hypothetical protein ABN16_03430 [Levilactobacillus koreensis]KRK87965.1 hypothetical protein FC99_GL000771 [Levilactobacillus koreensis JCM 16448]